MDVETRSGTVKTPDGEMPMHVARPKGAGGKLPAVIVVQEAFGLNGNIRETAERIAAEGYQTVAPNFYYREGGKAVGYGELQDAIGLMNRWTDAQIVTDVRAAVGALEADPGVRADRLGITGFCMGGRVSYLAACEVPAIRAAVPFYGGAIAGQQFAPGAVTPVSLTSKMRAAVQLHFGEKDAYIPLSAVDEIRKTLEREKKDFEVHVYPGAGHGFFCRERADYNEAAAKLAWDRTKTFFKKHLQG
jgi:carboxymethylenebutenolidase